MNEYSENLDRIKGLIKSDNLQDNTDADTYLKRLSISELHALYEYCSRLLEITGDRNFKYAISRIKTEARIRYEKEAIYDESPVSTYLSRILSTNITYPIARRPGHLDKEGNPLRTV